MINNGAQGPASFILNHLLRSGVLALEADTMKTSIVLILGLALGSQTPSIRRPSFEVATIKQNISGQDGGGIGLRGDLLLARNVSLRTLVNYAYAPKGGMLLMSQIIGGPAWTNTDHFDIEAKVNGDIRSIPRDQVGMM